MGRILISAGHGGSDSGSRDPGTVVAGTTESREMILTRDLIVTELRSRGFEVLSVPDDLGTQQTLDWINDRTSTQDVCLTIHADADANPLLRGTTVYHIAHNEERKRHADLLQLALIRRVPTLPNRGVRPDTATTTGSLAVCRQLIAPSMVLEIGFLSNPEDRFILQTRRRDVALGIADGLAAWSRAIDTSAAPPMPVPTPTPTVTPTPSIFHAPCAINLNGQIYGEPGLIVSGNALVPIDLVDRLSLDVSQNTNIRKISHHNVVYIKAVDLRELNVSINWDATTRTVFLRTILQVCPDQLGQIAGYGRVSPTAMLMFLKSYNEAALTDYRDVPLLYVEESKAEGINHDVAFAHMCLETSYLNFGGTLQAQHFNFGALGGLGGDTASFPSARTGIRAHIQHLKAYANIEPLVQEVVDPRFNYVARGVAPFALMLTGRWNPAPDYGLKIMSILRQLYESSGLL